MTQTRSYTVVDTGQTLYYDNTKVISSPSTSDAFYGQDAQYTGTQPDYVDNGNGTVSDLATGLTWSQTSPADMSWSDAVAYADSLVLGGYDDWRLPTIKELYSLIDFSGYSGVDEASSVPYIDTSFFNFSYGDTSTGERFIDAQYWSSTVYVGTTMTDDATVFGVNFADGRIKGYPQLLMDASVIVVRGNTSYGENDFFDNGDGTINDYATGLMWSSADSGAGMDWQTALSYAESSTLAGYSDWFLPNAKELQSIVDYTQAPDATDPADIGPAIDDLYFTLTNTGTTSSPDYGYYWTSTTHVEGGTGDYAAYLALGTAWGEIDGTAMDVHGAGAQRSDPKYDDGTWPTNFGPQGDLLTIDNYVLIAREMDDDVTVSGGSGADSLSGLTGDDVITGGGGNDTIDGSAGRDWVTLGDGGGAVSLTRVETLLGGAGADSVRLGDTDGTLIMAAIETLIGGTGADWITLGNRGNTVVLGAIETLLGGTGSDSVQLDDQGDTLILAAVETVIGGAGSDFLMLGNRGNTMAVSGVDIILGGTSSDSLTLGDSGNTVIVAAVETVIGGVGSDAMELGNRGVTVTMSGVESVLGGNATDAVTVSGATSLRFAGGDGGDVLTLASGAGADRIVFSASSDGAAAGSVSGYDIIRNFDSGTDQVVIADALASAVSRISVLSNAVSTLADSEFTAFRSALGAVASGASSTTLVVASDGTSSGLYLISDNGDGAVAASEVSLLAVFEGCVLGTGDVGTA